MKIETTSARINVSDHKDFGGVNIGKGVCGYAATLSFWGGAAYLCKRKEDPFPCVVVVPGAHWLKDVQDDGWEVIGLLSDFVKSKELLRDAANELDNYIADCAKEEAPEEMESLNLLASECRRIGTV